MENYTQYVIRGSVIAEQQISERWTDFDDVARLLTKDASYLLGRLHPNTIYVSVQGDYTRYVLEYPPAVVPCTFSVRPDTRGIDAEFAAPDPSKRVFDISLPYSIFGIVFVLDAVHRVYYWWSKRSVTGYDQPIYQAGLPNLHDDGRICMGPYSVDPKVPYSERIEKIVQTFWNYRFNADLADSFYRLVSKLDAVSLQDIEDKGKEDPGFQKTRFRKIGPLSEVIERS